jgi:hypothetical protein
VITSFADKESEKVFAGQFSRKLPRPIQSGAQQKMIILNLTQIPKFEVLERRRGLAAQGFPVCSGCIF